MDYSYIDSNYAEILREISNVSTSMIEKPELLPVIKNADIGEIEYLARKYGIVSVGENRVQQLLSRYDDLRRIGVDIQFIGHLQTNKVKYIIDKVSLIQSLDRIELAREIDRQAYRAGIVMDVLVEINCAREASKGGVLPENAEAFCAEIASYKHLNLRGFMTMGKKFEKNDEYLKYFCETYQLVLDIWQKKLHNIGSPVLSMGMSDSFLQALQAGATQIRIGRRLFNK